MGDRTQLVPSVIDGPALSHITAQLLGRGRLRHLQIFLTVSEMGSLRKAAEVLPVTQPAITAALGDLEEMLGCELFERHARGMRPTPYAIAITPWIRKMLESLERSAEAVLSLRKGLEGTVHIIANPSSSASILAPAVPYILDTFPRLALNVAEAADPEILAKVPERQYDIHLLREPKQLPSGFRFIGLRDDQCVIVAGPQHPLAAAAVVTRAELIREAWIVSPQGSPGHAVFEEVFASDLHRMLTRTIETRVLMLTCAMLRQSSSLMLLPLNVVRQILDLRLLSVVAYPVHVKLPRIGALVAIEGLSASAAQALAAIEEVARRQDAARH